MPVACEADAWTRAERPGRGPPVGLVMETLGGVVSPAQELGGIVGAGKVVVGVPRTVVVGVASTVVVGVPGGRVVVGIPGGRVVPGRTVVGGEPPTGDVPGFPPDPI